MEIDVIVVTAMSKGRSSGAWGQGLSIDEAPPHRSRQKRHPELDRRRSALKRAVPKEISK